MELDQKALGAAIIAGDKHWEGDKPSTGIYEAAIRAYLAALPSDDEVGRLIKRADRRCENGKVFHAERTLIKELSVALQSQAAELAAVKAEADRRERELVDMLNSADKSRLAQITRVERAEAALADIAEMTDADDPESYRCDDREGCLDAVHAAARRAHSKDGGERNG